MPITIYWSRPITWYPQNTRVLKLVNFTLQYLKKPDLFDLTDNFPNSVAQLSGLQPLRIAHTKKLVQFFPKVTITNY